MSILELESKVMLLQGRVDHLEKIKKDLEKQIEQLKAEKVVEEVKEELQYNEKNDIDLKSVDIYA